MSSCDGLYWYKSCVWSRSWSSRGIGAFPTGNNRFYLSTEMLLLSDLAMKDWSRAEVCEKSLGQLQLCLLSQENKLSLHNYIYPRACTTLGLCFKYSISKAGPWGGAMRLPLPGNAEVPVPHRLLGFSSLLVYDRLKVVVPRTEGKIQEVS